MSFSNSQIHNLNLPKLEEVSLNPISKNYFKVIAFNTSIFYVIVFIIMFVLKRFVDSETFQDCFWLLFSFIAFLFLFNLTISMLSMRKRRYAIREHDVIYSKGLLVNRLTTVPISRIQHIEESRSWLERMLHLSTLNIFTAGESGSDLSIKGLSTDEAKQINDYISSKVNGNTGLFTTE